MANYAGQIWVGLMALAFIPAYINYLGMEAYGLIGIYTLLQAWLLRLDLGLTPTLGREMARVNSGSHTPESIRDLLRSVELLVAGIAVLMTLVVWAASGWLARDWLRSEQVPVGALEDALGVMGAVAAVRFAEGVYRSSIVGLQRHVVLNAVSAGMATVRGVGAIAVLALVSPTIHAFFVWQIVTSLGTLCALAFLTYRSLPPARRFGRFSTESLRSIRRFSGGVASITLMSALLTQVDKIVLSRVLTLSDFGYYTLAAIVAGVLSMVIGPIGQAWYPRLSELQAIRHTAALIRTFHQGAQLVTVLVGSSGAVLIVFAEPILYLWTWDAEVAARIAPLVRLLTVGNLLNALMWIPYKTQLAYGWTGLTARINFLSVLVLVPTILWVTPRYGAIGASWVWIALNAGYLLVGVHFMFRRILIGEKARWYTHDILLPLGAALAVTLSARVAFQDGSFLAQLGLVLGSAALALLAALVATPQLREVLPSVLGHRPFRVKSS